MPILINRPFRFIHTLRLIQIGGKNVPITVDRTLEKEHRLFCFSQLPSEGFQLGPNTAETGIGLEGEGPALRLFVHHLEQIAATLLGCGELLELILVALNIAPSGYWFRNNFPILIAFLKDTDKGRLSRSDIALYGDPLHLAPFARGGRGGGG